MKRVALLLCGVLLSTASMADEECSVDLRHDLRVTSESLEVSSEGKTLYEIRRGGHLSVKGKPVELTGEQQELAGDYAGDVAAVVVQWIELVSNALEVVGKSLGAAFGEAFGPDSPAAVNSARAVAKAKEKFDGMTKAEDGVFRLSLEQFNELGDSLGEDVESAIATSMGSLFVEIGKAMMPGEGSFGERMEAFGNRMDRMGHELEQMGDILEDTGAALCEDMKEIRQREKQLLKGIPELSPYPLFD